MDLNVGILVINLLNELNSFRVNGFVNLFFLFFLTC
uniref:Uncharacterized protein n=1 Tax=Rhizophora mucronata TaxID=61149 RepID=A0A2P2QGI5_RHIMU